MHCNQYTDNLHFIFCFVKLKELTKQIRSDSGVVIKDRSYFFRTYTSCFIGKRNSTVITSKSTCTAIVR